MSYHHERISRCWAYESVKDRFYKFIREREQSLQSSSKEKACEEGCHRKRLYNAVAAIFAEDLAKERRICSQNPDERVGPCHKVGSVSQWYAR